MPGKSRRKGKYSIQNKKQVGQSRANPVVKQPSAAQVNPTSPISNMAEPPRVAPVSPRVAPARPARGAEQMAKPTGIRYAFVATELRTIGILAGLMLILLVVLARVLA